MSNTWQQGQQGQGEQQGELAIGRPQASPTTGSHVRGVHQGNEPGNLRRSDGIVDEGRTARGTARRSTSVNPHARGPIDPRSPNLSPA
jgi:hypothetical protein